MKVGEPGFPVAAMEHGEEVIVSMTETFVVRHHDFMKFSLWWIFQRVLGTLAKYIWGSRTLCSNPLVLSGMLQSSMTYF